MTEKIIDSPAFEKMTNAERQYIIQKVCKKMWNNIYSQLEEMYLYSDEPYLQVENWDTECSIQIETDDGYVDETQAIEETVEEILQFYEKASD
jgi:spore cortex formation protein SpoVR/YcgB (stage V sporulation)